MTIEIRNYLPPGMNEVYGKHWSWTYKHKKYCTYLLLKSILHLPYNAKGPVPKAMQRIIDNMIIMYHSKYSDFPTLSDLRTPSDFRSPNFRTIHYTRYSPSQMDRDNLVSTFKFIGDSLKTIGIITDDSPDHIDLQVTQEFSKESKIKIIIS